MSRVVSKYRVYCNTDAKYEYTWDVVKPTSCPVDGTHSIDASATVIIDEVREDSIAITENLDGFGRLTVSKPFTMFAAQYMQYGTGLSFDTKVVGTASVTKHVELGHVELATFTTGDKAVVQSKEYVPYQPGQSRNCMFTGVFNPKGVTASGFRTRIGVFDDHVDKVMDSKGNGNFFEFSDGILYAVERSSTDGVANQTDIRVPQSEWNIDRMDGTGESGYTIDPTKGLLMVININWLGLGNTRYGFIINNRTVWVHIFSHKDYDRAYTKSAKLPIRYEVENVSGGAVQFTCHYICSCIQSENGVPARGLRWSIVEPIVKTVPMRNPMHIVTLRMKGTSSRDTIVISDIQAYCDNIANIKVIWNATIDYEDTPEWISAGDTSICEYTTMNGKLMSSGHTMFNFFMEQNSSKSIGTLDNHMLVPGINSNIAGESDTISIFADGIAKTVDCYLTFSWHEIY
jgi:hypothetical protein